MMRTVFIAFGYTRREETPNDLKLSDGGVRRGTCMAGGKAAAEAGAVTHGAVRCSAWLGASFDWEKSVIVVLIGSCADVEEIRPDPRDGETADSD